MTRKLMVVMTSAVMVLGPVSAAIAAPPGPGDKQCVPGQNPQPQPGKKGGTCPGK